MPKAKLQPENIVDRCIRENLSKDDIELIAQIHIDPKYKALSKLIDNIIIDLENNAFESAKTLDEFLGVTFTRKALIILKSTVMSKYNLITNKSYAKRRREEGPDLESFGEGLEVTSEDSIQGTT